MHSPSTLPFDIPDLEKGIESISKDSNDTTMERDSRATTINVNDAGKSSLGPLATNTKVAKFSAAQITHNSISETITIPRMFRERVSC